LLRYLSLKISTLIETKISTLYKFNDTSIMYFFHKHFVYRHLIGAPDIQHNDTQHNDTQHNDTQHNDTRHNNTQHNDTHHNDIQLNNTLIATLHKDAQHNGTLNGVLLSVINAECHKYALLPSVVIPSVFRVNIVAPSHLQKNSLRSAVVLFFVVYLLIVME
jgi:hypothetical protein